MNNNSKLVSSLLMGAAAGAAIALYLTSESGTKLRQTVSEKASDLFNDLKAKAEASKDAITSMTEKFGASAENLAKKANNVVPNGTKSPSEMYV